MKRLFTKLTNDLRQINWKKRDRKPANRSRGRHQPPFVPCVEALEDRCLLAPTFTVTTKADSGTGSLREAITMANSNPGSTINFDAKKVGGQTISLLSPLPDVTAASIKITALDQNNDPENITLDGTSAGNTDGLVLSGNDSSVLGLGIQHFEAAGILVEGTLNTISMDTIVNNGTGVYIFQALDTEINANKIRNNSGDGIQVFQSAGITINNQDPRNEDSINGNGVNGIRVIGEMANSGRSFVTDISDNYIYENQANGIDLVDTSNNRIEGQNVIGGWTNGNATDSGNAADGILIETPVSGSSSSNLIDNNYIGGNNGDGVSLMGDGASNNTLTHNFIGFGGDLTVIDQSYTLTPTPISNKLDGVSISQSANNNIIGGIGLFLNDNYSSGVGNVISNNLLSGIEIGGVGTTANQVQGNLIGTNTDGVKPLANGYFGVTITNGATNNRIGGTGSVAVKTGQGNVISFHSHGGVFIAGAGTNSNQLQGNFIGTDYTGTTALPNLIGVEIEQGASKNTVGGGPGLGDLISGNLRSGVLIDGASTTGNLISNSRIGTDVSGTSALGNMGEGVVIADGASGNSVGGANSPMLSNFLRNLISGNFGNGVVIQSTSTSNNLVQGNYIGTNVLGNQPLANQGDGVLLFQSGTGNVIGGSSTPFVSVENLISGNFLAGVAIDQSNAGNLVQGNYIGTNAAGTARLSINEGNYRDGVDLLSSGEKVIGNLISGNGYFPNPSYPGGNGVVIEGSQNLVQGNKIGTDVTGSNTVKNKRDGILVSVQIGSGGNILGGTATDGGNLISGNGANGIHLTGPASSGNLIQGNDIGTDVGGHTAIANFLNGILIDNTSGYIIGGTTAGAANLISGNGGGLVAGQMDGVQITNSLSSGIVLAGNQIGTDVTGTMAVANPGNGIDILNGAHNNVVGSGNLISGNKGDGVRIVAANNNVISGNRIGTDISGTLYLSNQGNGVDILYATATNNTVGGSVAGASNLISGNILDGVRIALEANANKVLGNLIGTNVNGALPLHNANGVDILQAAYNNTIGGGNVISGNNQNGIVITGSGTNFNQVQGNFIGSDKSGLKFLPNQGDGVDVDQGTARNQIGGPGGVTGGGAGNLISGNLGDGVQIINGASFNVLDGNVIGADASAAHAPLPNFGHGVFVGFGAHNNTIGGTATPGNLIAFNGKAGVTVGIDPSDIPTVHNLILSNSIYANKGLGIDLANNGVTFNTPGGPHPGPNDFQNFPVILDAAWTGSVTTVALALNSILNTPFTIQLFVALPDPTGYGQGRFLVATVPLSTDASGNGAVVVTVNQNLTGAYLTATATAAGPYNETSEFSQDFQVKSSTAGSMESLSFKAAAPDSFGSAKGDNGTATPSVPNGGFSATVSPSASAAGPSSWPQAFWLEALLLTNANAMDLQDVLVLLAQLATQLCDGQRN
jgi:hypothetical protein